MNFDGSRCGDCNKEIYQRQRFCDKCGNRLDHSINEGKSPKGKKKGVHVIMYLPSSGVVGQIMSQLLQVNHCQFLT